MTDQQLLTLALSIIIPISVMIYSNSRVGEVSKRIDDSNNRVGEVSKRIDDLAKRIDERFNNLQQALEERIDNGFEHMNLLLKLHEAEHHKR